MSSDSQNSSDSRPGPPSAPQACLPCRNKHKRCDGGKPCSKCVRIGRASDCTYAPPKRRGPRPTESIYEYCDNLKNELEMQKQIAEHWKEQFIQLEAQQKELRSSSPHSSSSSSSVDSSPGHEPTLIYGGGAGLSSTNSADSGAASFYTLQAMSADGSSLLPSLTIDLAAQFARASLLDTFLYHPEFDIATPSPRMMIELSIMSPISVQHLRNVNPMYLVNFYTQAVFGLLGAGMCGYPEYAASFLQKAELFCSLLCSHDQELVAMRPDLAQPIATATLLLWTYLFSYDSYHEKKSLILLVYDMISQFNQRVSPGLMLRTHLCRLFISQTLEDAKFWYTEVLFVSGLHGSSSNLILRGIVDTTYGVTMCSIVTAGANQIPPEVLTAHEARLASLEFLIEQGVVVALQFPHLARELEASMMATRVAALATRARLCSLLDRPSDAGRLLEATCIVMKMMRPSYHLYIQSLNCALDAAVAIKSVTHLQMLLASLATVIPPSFPGLPNLKTRTVEALHLFGASPLVPLSPPPELSQDQKLLLAMKLRTLAAPSHAIALEFTQSALEAELAAAAQVVARFSASHAQIQAALNNEILSLNSL